MKSLQWFLFTQKMSIANNNQIFLYFIRLSQDVEQAWLKDCLAYLSEFEQARYQRFADENQAKQFLFGRYLLRHALSEHESSVLPEDWVFVMDDYGKPKLSGEFSYTNWHFNLSHSTDLVVLALSHRLEVGVDVEYVHRPVFNFALAERYFSKGEVEFLSKLSATDQPMCLAEMWTLKEAFLKCQGVGLRVPLRHISFSFTTNNNIELAVSESNQAQLIKPIEDACWLYAIGEDYRVALFAKAPTEKSSLSPMVTEWMPDMMSSTGLGENPSNHLQVEAMDARLLKSSFSLIELCESS